MLIDRRGRVLSCRVGEGGVPAAEVGRWGRGRGAEWPEADIARHRG
jgi:hypothetical protein